jgi:hypothetical protein
MAVRVPDCHGIAHFEKNPAGLLAPPMIPRQGRFQLLPHLEIVYSEIAQEGSVESAQ